MTSEQYRRVGELYHAAMGLAPEARVDFLTGECGDDYELRSEIESLLEAHERTDSYFGAPALEVALNCSVNKRFPRWQAEDWVTPVNCLFFFSSRNDGLEYRL